LEEKRKINQLVNYEERCLILIMESFKIELNSEVGQRNYNDSPKLIRRFSVAGAGSEMRIKASGIKACAAQFSRTSLLNLHL
jgi:hypothetical protein